MEEAPVTAATGALGPVIAKLAALLGSEYKLRWCTRRDVSFIRSKLNPVHSLLWNIWEREVLDEASRALKMEALDLADHVDDAIFDFILSLERNLNTKQLVQIKIKASPFQHFKKRVGDVSGRCRSRWKEKVKVAADDSSPSKPRAYPFVRKDASELVAMARLRDDFIQFLIGVDERTPVEQPKTASIYGSAGMGKTTLADLVYQAIGDKFQSRAFVSVARPGGTMRKVLARILEQVAAVPLADSEAFTEEHLIDSISNLLKDKRYLVIIDDIWNWREWEVIMKSLPKNYLGSRVVRTTRTDAVAKKWHSDSHGPNSLNYSMLLKWYRKGWAYEIKYQNIANQMVAMKADLAAEGLDDAHPIVRLCGGTPLAVVCMLSAVAGEREKQGQNAKTCDVLAELEKHVIENGIQNTPGFEPLAESLQLGYDALPHHMLKTCLLYSSMYPGGHLFYKYDLVRRWISEGFVHKEEQANGYFEELVSRGLLLQEQFEGMGVILRVRMHPMMRNFLRRKSRQDNFTTCSSEITPSCRIRRLCICSSPCRSTDDATVDPLSALDWTHIRSLVICEGVERVPFEKLEGLRVLDLGRTMGLQDDHWKYICGLVSLRHLFGVNGDAYSKIPPEIVRLQCLETFEASGEKFSPLAGFIGELKQLKTLEVRGKAIKMIPKEIGALQQLQTLRIKKTRIQELPREIGSLQRLKTLGMHSSEIKELPIEISSLQQLKTLDMSVNIYFNVLPKDIWSLQQLETLNISRTSMNVLPREIRSLQQLKTLDISRTEIRELPKEIGELQQLKTLHIGHTSITALPKEIGKLQQLEHLVMTGTEVTKIPREIGALKELKSFKFDDFRVVELSLEVCASLVELPECVHQALNKSSVMSALAREMLSFRYSREMSTYGGLVVGAKQMHIPPWIKEHFNDLALLDIRICKLEKEGLKVLLEMPKLKDLTLRFEVVPTESVVISSEGFSTLKCFTVDSRVPRVTFQEGAMPMLSELRFQFRFYAGPPNKDPLGINHLTSLDCISFECNEDWYGGEDSLCIRPTIDVARKEAKELPRSSQVTLFVCGRVEELYLQLCHREEEQRNSGVCEIEEDIQA